MARKPMPNTRGGRYVAPPHPNPSGTWTWAVLPWELEPGDRVVGMSATVTGRFSYSEGDLGSYAQRARYTYPLSDGGTLTYSGDSPAVSVIRQEGPHGAPSA